MIGSDCMKKPNGSKSSRLRFSKSLEAYLKELCTVETEDILDLNAFKKKGSLLGNNNLGVLKRKSKRIKPRKRRVLSS